MVKWSIMIDKSIWPLPEDWESRKPVKATFGTRKNDKGLNQAFLEAWAKKYVAKAMAEGRSFSLGDDERIQLWIHYELGDWNVFFTWASWMQEALEKEEKVA